MKSRFHIWPSGRDRTWIPYLVLAVAVLGTVLGAYYVSVMARTEDHLRFSREVDQIQTSISTRLETYVAVIRSGAAMMSAHDTTSRDEFQRYVRRLNLSNRYPGLQGLGYSIKVRPEARDSLVAAMRNNGEEGFRLYPDTPRSEYHAIIYLDVPGEQGRGLIGYDLYTEPGRRAAMERARDSATTSATGLVKIMRVPEGHKQEGFVVFSPIYHGGVVPLTVAERRELLLGFVYSPFVATDLLKKIIGAERPANIDFQIFDDSAAGRASLLYSSIPDSLIGTSEPPTYTGTRLITIAGHPWQIVFTARREFEGGASGSFVKYIVGGGLLISLLLFAITLAQSRARTQAERIASELRQSDERLRESESRLRRLVDSDIIGIIIADMAGNVVEANNAFLNIIGYSRDDLHAGQINWADLTPPEYWSLDEDSIRQMRRSGSHPPFEKEFVRRDGTRVPVLVGTAYLGGPEDLGVGFLLDLSERKQIESAFRQAETRFRTMIEQSPLAMQLFSLDGQCILANPAWEDLWATSREVLATYNILDDHQLEENGVMPYIHRGFAGEVLVIPPFSYVPPQVNVPGRARWVRVFVYPLRDDRDRITEIAMKIEDVTDRIEADEQLRQAKEAAEAANRAKDQFLAILSHELRTPLTPVLTAINLLEQEAATTDYQRMLIEIVHRNVELEARLIDDLLDLTRISNGKLQLNTDTVDANTLIRNALEIIESEITDKSLELTLDLAAERHTIHGDPARLQQVFWNLLKNAVKFTPQGGHIGVSTANHNGRLRVDVSDTGIGIDPDVLPHIFNAFEQGEQKITKQFGGMGLGLAISKTLIGMHGGRLTAASRGPGHGATFTVELDTVAAHSNGSAPAPHRVAATISNESARILLVEDHVDTSVIMKQLLERQGYSVTAADSIGAAMQAASAQSFDLLISDIGLPDGSGLELIERLGERCPPKAIALSGYGMEDDIRRSIDAGFVEHITKPVNFRRLHEVIRELLG